MTFESAEIESSRSVTPKIKGKRAAKRKPAPPKPRGRRKKFKRVVNPAIPKEPENWDKTRSGIIAHHENSIKRIISLELSGNGFPYDIRAINRDAFFNIRVKKGKKTNN